jgi:hypothetical protein
VISLGRVFHGNGAVSGEQGRHRVPMNRKAVERGDDRDADPFLEDALQRPHVGAECVRIEIVEPDSRARTNGRRRHVKTREGWERNDGAFDLADGHPQGDLQGLGAASEEECLVG